MEQINPLNIVNMLTEFFVKFPMLRTPQTNKEFILFNSIKDIILENMNSYGMDVEQEIALEFEEDTPFYEAEPIEEEDVESEQSDSMEGECSSSQVERYVSETYKRNAVQFWESGKTRKLGLKSVQHNYRYVQSVNQLHRWKKSLISGGSRNDKLTRITEFVLMKFRDAIDIGGIVHDLNLRKWALIINNDEVKLDNFKASTKWVFNFKTKYRIVSRKITKFTTKFSTENSEHLLKVSNDFVSNVIPYMDNYNYENTYNADESGFNLEMHSGRTLTSKGIKNVEAEVQSVTSTTHSYTIVPTVSAEGKLLPVLFIVLKEPDGKFGPRVQENMFSAPNIYVVPSASGKLTSAIFQEWFIKVYLENTNSNRESILLLDSWGGHSSEKLKALVPAERTVNIFTIPKKATSLIQPLDVYGFRFWKNFIRTFSDLIIINNYDINLHLRNNILKIQSLAHNQMSAPRFRNLFLYGWYKSGYTKIRPEKFETPNQFCFRGQEDLPEPECNICGTTSIFRCAWCRKYLCIRHFFEDFHFCSYDVDAEEADSSP